MQYKESVIQVLDMNPHAAARDVIEETIALQ
jgi:hypothetical protein